MSLGEFISVLLLVVTLSHFVPAMLSYRMREMNEAALVERAAALAAAGNDARYHPTPVDIFVMRVMLMRCYGLPPDLVDAIFDYAEYWARSSNSIDYVVEQRDIMRINGTGPREDRLLLRSFPLGLTAIYDGDQRLAEELVYDSSEARPLPLLREHSPSFFAGLANYPTPWLARPCRKIVFSIRSRDQGWGGDPGCEGTFRSAWTWFEAGLERFDASQTCDDKCTYDLGRHSPTSPLPLSLCSLRPQLPNLASVGDDTDNPTYAYNHPLYPREDYLIQRNMVAIQAWQDHVVTWSYLDDVDPDSDAGDELEILGRGRLTAKGTFVRGMKLGDVVTVWGKARFPAWVNNIESIKIDVYWAV